MGAESNMLGLAFRQMVAGDFGGTITWAGQNYPAAIGMFELHQVLNADGGGFSPMTSAIVTVAREDMPASFNRFKRGEIVTCTPADTTRTPRTCRVYDMRDCGALIELTVNDVGQGG